MLNVNPDTVRFIMTKAREFQVKEGVTIPEEPLSPSEWDDALAQAGDSWNERTADYLIGTPLLADYLEEGLELLGYSGSE